MVFKFDQCWLHSYHHQSIGLLISDLIMIKKLRHNYYIWQLWRHLGQSCTKYMINTLTHHQTPRNSPTSRQSIATCTNIKVHYNSPSAPPPKYHKHYFAKPFKKRYKNWYIGGAVGVGAPNNYLFLTSYPFWDLWWC